MLEAIGDVRTVGPGPLAAGKVDPRSPDPVGNPAPEPCPPPKESAAEETLFPRPVLCPLPAHTVVVRVIVTVGVIGGGISEPVVTAVVTVTVVGGRVIVSWTVTVEGGGQSHAADGPLINPVDRWGIV